MSQIIEVLDDRLGTDFTTSDQLFFDQIEEDMVTDEVLLQQAQSNTRENFKFGFDDKFMDAVISRMDQNQAMATQMIDDDKMIIIVKAMMMDRVRSEEHTSELQSRG